VTQDSVRIEQPNPTVLKRADVVRVSDGDHVYNVVYSGRSFSSDVTGVPPSAISYIRVVMTDGEHYEGSAAQLVNPK
jgi:hypothetical protein